MPFVEIVKGTFGKSMPDNVLRVNRYTIALSANLSETFQAGRTVTKGGSRESVRLGISVDVEAKQVKLDATSINGYSFQVPTDGGQRALTVAMPAAFRRTGIPIGDYLLTSKTDLVFTLADEITPTAPVEE